MRIVVYEVVAEVGVEHPAVGPDDVGGPAATTAPESSTVTWSHSPITNSMLCSTIRKVLPAAFSSRIRSAM